MTNIKKLQQHYADICEWNKIAGNDHTADTKNQVGRVQEEINEMALTMATEVTLASTITLLDDFCDIFVTGVYLDYMQNNRLPDIGHMIGVTSIPFAQVTPNNALQFVFSNIDYDLFDIVGGIGEVIDNNYTKFIEASDRDALEQSLNMFDKLDVPVYVVDYNDATTHLKIIKRRYDNKIMKPYGFVSVDLSPYVY